MAEHFLNKPAAPPDLLEENLIISDVAAYMGYPFEAGYRDYDSNVRKLVEDLGAAISQHLDGIRLKRQKESERKMAALIETTSVESGHPN